MLTWRASSLIRHAKRRRVGPSSRRRTASWSSRAAELVSRDSVTARMYARQAVLRSADVLRIVAPHSGATECVIVSHLMAHSRGEELTRTNVTLPASLLAQVDELAGARGRSRYVAEAVAQRVRRDALGAAIRETAGAMIGRRGWMSPDEVAAWVDDLRSEETE